MLHRPAKAVEILNYDHIKLPATTTLPKSIQFWALQLRTAHPVHKLSDRPVPALAILPHLAELALRVLSLERMIHRVSGVEG
jgi:hypothetical protein